MLVLIAPESYRSASRAEIESRTNGCGPEGWRGEIRDDLDSLAGLDISEACRVHDWMYGLGGSDEQRLEADITLYLNIAAVVLHTGGPLTPVRMAGAAAMYVAVRAGGHKHWQEAA